MAHHHANPSSRLGEGPQPVRQVVSEAASDDGSVCREAVNELTSSGLIKESHLLPQNRGEKGFAQVSYNLLPCENQEGLLERVQKHMTFNSINQSLYFSQKHSLSLHLRFAWGRREQHLQPPRRGRPLSAWYRGRWGRMWNLLLGWCKWCQSLFPEKMAQTWWQRWRSPEIPWQL